MVEEKKKAVRYLDSKQQHRQLYSFLDVCKFVLISKDFLVPKRTVFIVFDTTRNHRVCGSICELSETFELLNLENSQTISYNKASWIETLLFIDFSLKTRDLSMHKGS
jgi:hypothetical protein